MQSVDAAYVAPGAPRGARVRRRRHPGESVEHGWGHHIERSAEG